MCRGAPSWAVPRRARRARALRAGPAGRARAARARADSGRSSKLASNEGPYGPMPAAAEAIARALAEANRYPDGGCWALRAALAERHGVAFERGRGGQRRRRGPELPRARDARARRRGRLLLAVVPGLPHQRDQDGRRAGHGRPLRRLVLRPRRAAGERHGAHEARLRHEPEQPDGRHGRARCAAALPRRAARARAAGGRRGLLRVRRRPRLSRHAARARARRPARGRAAHVLEDLRAGRPARRLRHLPRRRRSRLPEGQERLRRRAGGAGRGAREPRRGRRARAPAARDDRRARRCSCDGLRAHGLEPLATVANFATASASATAPRWPRRSSARA